MRLDIRAQKFRAIQTIAHLFRRQIRRLRREIEKLDGRFDRLALLLFRQLLGEGDRVIKQPLPTAARTQRFQSSQSNGGFFKLLQCHRRLPGGEHHFRIIQARVRFFRRDRDVAIQLLAGQDHVRENIDAGLAGENDVLTGDEHVAGTFFFIPLATRFRVLRIRFLNVSVSLKRQAEKRSKGGDEHRVGGDESATVDCLLLAVAGRCHRLPAPARRRILVGGFRGVECNPVQTHHLPSAAQDDLLAQHGQDRSGPVKFIDIDPLDLPTRRRIVDEEKFTVGRQQK